MFAWLTWRLGAILLAGGLAVTLFDGIRSRAEIAARDKVIAMQMTSIETTGRNLGTCQANTATIGAAVDRQNMDIRKLAEASAAATARAEKSLAAIAGQAKAAREASQRVLARPLPLPDLACMEAARLLREGG